METRIEIYKDELWQPLRLKGNSSIKYNSVINKVGKIESREISHTNTFSLPYIHENIEALGLNVFNTRDMAKALNTKYKAKYFVNDRVLQEGFILINNSSDGVIKLNFIDEALGLIEEWGGMTFRELLRDSEANIPADYATAIDELRTYQMSKVYALSQTSEVGSRGHNLALFPNNLNQIGDKFQLNQSDDRIQDEFNPYQSRPVFSAKAVFDLATETFGYTATYDDSIDWDLVSETYMTDSTEDKNEEDAGSTSEFISQPVSLSAPYYYRRDDTFFPNGPNEGELWFSRYYTKTFIQYHPSISTAPIFIDDWVRPEYNAGYPVVVVNDGGYVVNYEGTRCVLTPSVDNGNVGSIRWMANLPAVSGSLQIIAGYEAWACYKRLGGGDILWSKIPVLEGATHVTFEGDYDIDVTFDKAIFDSYLPVGGGDLIGVMMMHSKSTMINNDAGGGKIYNAQIMETSLVDGAITFDDYGQYEPNEVDLTHGASKKTIKELISALMHKEGILMNINAKNKTIKFFGYNHYFTQRDDGNFYDWSDYLLKHNNIVRNTDYGTKFAKRNRVSLTDPFQGNFYDVTLLNQGDNSKYVDFTTNEVKQFKDVVNVLSIDNSTTNDWLEYETKGFSLVEYTGLIEPVAPYIKQARADGDWQGVVDDLPKLANVNYARLPEGLKAWYSLVDAALRVTAEFMIPLDVITNIDLSQPVYVEELGGYYIIEEIAEYINGVTPVKVKLIRLESVSGLVDGIPKTSGSPMVIESKSADATDNKYEIAVYTTALEFGITTSTGYAKQLTNHPDDGGTYTGLEFTQTLLTTADDDLTTRQTIFSETSVTTAQEGWYEVYVEMTGTPSTKSITTATTITSESQYAYLGDVAQAPELLIGLNVSASDLAGDDKAVFTTKLKNFADITDVVATCEYQKLSGPNGTATGPLRVVSIADLQEKSETEITFQDKVGFYKVNFKTTEADSEDNAFGGFYIT